MQKSLEGITVVAVEQAVAAPYASSRLADAGARVIKIERPEGDFARHYDKLVRGQSAYFVWLNRGKESVCLDLSSDADRAVLDTLIVAADVFIQNLKPGSIEKLGFGSGDLRRRFPRLITCDISGFGEKGQYFGQNMRRVYFGLSGSDANETNIKLGSVEIQRELMTAEQRWIMAAKH